MKVVKKLLPPDIEQKIIKPLVVPIHAIGLPTPGGLPLETIIQLAQGDPAGIASFAKKMGL